jgi:hypothetical protein
MHFHEELLTDERFQKLHGNRQTEHIKNYCNDIEDKIRTAASFQEATWQRDLACAQFNKQCPGAIVQTAFTHRVNELILRYWPNK